MLNVAMAQPARIRVSDCVQKFDALQGKRCDFYELMIIVIGCCKCGGT